jgi:hypothetical protein
VHIPYHITWDLEHVPVSSEEALRYTELEDIRLLPGYVEGLCHAQA